MQWSLSSEREKRLAARRETQGAINEVSGDALTLDFGGEQKVALGPEFPLTVLAPLRDIDDEMTYTVKQALSIIEQRRKAAGEEAGDIQWEATQMVVDLLVMSPNLPTKFVDVALAIGRELLGEQGMNDLIAAKPSAQDIGALVQEILAWYGLTLGEVSRSSDSSIDGGATSNSTSSITSASTPETSSDQHTIPA